MQQQDVPRKGDVGEAVPRAREELAHGKERGEQDAVPHNRRHQRQRDAHNHHNGRNQASRLRAEKCMSDVKQEST